MTYADTTILKRDEICSGVPSSAEPETFKRAMGSFPSGVTVITSLDSNGDLCGLTANAFSSVSIDPPLILVCVNYGARCYQAIDTSQRFAVHILKSDQEKVAMEFARKGADRSKICPWETTKRNVPILKDFHTALECEVYEDYEGGDHAILVGRVLRVHSTSNTAPLLYYSGDLFPLDR